MSLSKAPHKETGLAGSAQKKSGQVCLGPHEKFWGFCSDIPSVDNFFKTRTVVRNSISLLNYRGL